VELGENGFQSGDPGHFMLVDRNAASVIGDRYQAVGKQGNGNLIRVSSHGFIDGIIDHFPDEVVQAGAGGGADIHARALTYRIKAFKDSYLVSAVAAFFIIFFAHKHKKHPKNWEY